MAERRDTSLPELMVVTDRRLAATAGHRLVDVVAGVATSSVAVLVREKDLPRLDRSRLVAELRAVTVREGALLLVASDAVLARDHGADGVHLAARDRWPAPELIGRSPSASSDRLGTGMSRSGEGEGLIVGRSCHTEAELAAAATEGSMYATYSPVFATRSKPGYGPALRRDGLAAACRRVSDLPIVALGGVTLGLAAACRHAGARAVAVMGTVMTATEPATVVRALLEELAEAESTGWVDG